MVLFVSADHGHGSCHDFPENGTTENAITICWKDEEQRTLL
jgi:hypothetical protein